MAVPAANVDDVWTGTPAYTGAGVLVGVIDSGIDWRHDDFRNANGTTRIKAIWDLYGAGSPPPTGFTDGAEWDENEINASLTGGGSVNEEDNNGHGTHVTGIAAGNGRASSGPVPRRRARGRHPLRQAVQQRRLSPRTRPSTP